MNTLTIPKKLTEQGDLVIVPRFEFEEAIRVKKRLLLEEQDTDEAIKIFEVEHKTGKLKKTANFSSILSKPGPRS